MGLAFWRSKKRAADAAAKPATRPALSTDDDADPRLDSAAGLRARARHRLIGAAALLLAVAIVVPMVLDPEPKPVSENIPIDIPSERTPFTPRLSLPAVPAADVAGTPPPDQAPASAAKSDPRPEQKPEPKSESAAAPKGEAKPERVDARLEAKAEPRTEEPKAARPEEPRKEAALPAAVRGGKFAVQAAAPASEKAARELAERLKKSGFTSYTEKVETKDGARYRVRVGPYASRDDAERARARLKAQGVGGNLVTL
jgi:DedD protein